jgi:hypothetical protein
MTVGAISQKVATCIIIYRSVYPMGKVNEGGGGGGGVGKECM